MTEGRTGRDVGIKIKLNKKIKCPRNTLMEIIRLFKEEDEEAMLVNGKERYQEEHEIPMGTKFIEAFKVDGNRSGEIYIYKTVRTTKSLKDLKWGNNRRTMNWLSERHIFIILDRWETNRARTIGFIIKVHPTVTWKADYKDRIMKELGK